MSNDIEVVELCCRIELGGRYKAIKHKGHKFDEDGKLVEFGEVIEETGWGKNIITLVGINSWLGSAETQLLWAVAGTSNAAPSESDTVLGAYAGKQTTRPINNVITRQTDPGAGDLYIRQVQRSTFNPGAFGESSVNIAEAGMTIGQPSLASVNAATQLFSRGLLVDGGGSPTTVSVAPDEYLDIVWEFTIYVPYNASGTVSLTIDGTPTDHTYNVRPLRLDGTGSAWTIAANNAGTFAMSLNSPAPVIGTGTVITTGSGVTNQALTTPTVSPSSFASSADRPSALTQSSYTAGSKQRQVNATWTVAAGNVAAPGVQMVVIANGVYTFQVSYDPPIAKNSSKQLNLTFMFSFANR